MVLSLQQGVQRNSPLIIFLIRGELALPYEPSNLLWRAIKRIRRQLHTDGHRSQIHIAVQICIFQNLIRYTPSGVGMANSYRIARSERSGPLTLKFLQKSADRQPFMLLLLIIALFRISADCCRVCFP